MSESEKQAQYWRESARIYRACGRLELAEAAERRAEQCEKDWLKIAANIVRPVNPS